MSEKLTGGCLCGAIRIEVRGPFLGRVECHCRQCRKVAGGGPSHLVQVRAEDFRIVGGAPAAHESVAASGAPVIRYFCDACGTPLHSLPTRFEGMVVVKAGVFDDEMRFQPDAIIWTSEAAPGAAFPTDTPQFPKGSS